MTAQTVPAVLEARARSNPDAPAISFKGEDKAWHEIPYRDLWTRVVAVDGGLAALGVPAGRWIVVIGDGSGPVAPRFWPFIMGVYRHGGSVACLGGRRLDELLDTLDRCSPVAIACESEKALALAAQAAGELAKSGRSLPPVIRLEDKPKPPPADVESALAGATVTTFDRLLDDGKAALAAGTISATGPGPAKPDDNALILLTSGSTGKRKAVPLTHANFWHSYAPAITYLGVDHRDSLLQYMPAAHVLAHTLVYGVIHVGAKTCFTTADARLVNDIAPSGATVLPGPPRLGQVLMNTAEYEITRKGRFTAWLYRMAQRGSRAWQGWPPFLNALGLPLHGLGKALIYGKVRAKLGKVRLMIFGSAPLPYDVQRWLYTVGIPAINGYGLTEAPVIAVSDPAQKRRLGSIGRPRPGSEAAFLSEDGKSMNDAAGRPLERGNLLLRGGPVLRSYYNDPAADREGFHDGWFITGDLARRNAHGELVIEGRIKDIVVPVSGENLAPIPVESAIAGCAYVEQVIVVGDGCKSIGVLIVPNFDRLRTWAREAGIADADKLPAEDLVGRPEVRKLFTDEVKSRTNGMDALVVHGGAVSRVELLTEAFSVENGLLTPDVRKIRRRAIYERHSAVIAKLCG